MRTTGLFCAAALLATTAAAAQTRPARRATGATPRVEQAEPSRVQIALRDGRVSMSVHDASLAQVLSEYGRRFDVRIDALSGVGPALPVTIELSGVPEREAFEALLRGVGGFVLVPRTGPSDDRGTVSEFARIVVVPSGHTAVLGSAADAAVPRSFPVAPGVNRLLGPDGQPIPDDQADVPIVQPLPAPAARRSGRRP